MIARLLALAIAGALLAGAAAAQNIATGVYLCTVDQRAGIGANHLEGSGPPEAFIAEKRRVKFRIEIVRGPGFTINELSYDGPDHNIYVWQTPNAVLHSAYRGDGNQFTAAEDQGFLRIGPDLKLDVIWFWHSAFEYPGGEDVVLAIRSGTCVREKNTP